MQRLEVAAARRREKRIDDRALTRPVGFHLRVGALHPSAGAARELSGRRRRAADDGRDLVERHAERVVQHEREPLGRREEIEHDEQRGPDRVGEQRLRCSGSMLMLSDRRSSR